MGVVIDALVTVDPIDWSICAPLFPSLCLPNEADQSDEVMAEPSGVSFVNLVQRDGERPLFPAMGYNIGSVALPGEIPMQLTNSSVIVPNTRHTEIDCLPEVQNAILAILRSL